MVKKEILGLQIEVDSAEIDKTDKKLRSLDKLLQQTQRRAAVLGKTKIAPKITLDDRFSSAAEKVKRTLTQIQRTKVRPVVHLVDNVSAVAARIQGSLIGLSMKSLRVSVEAVDWDGVVGGSFDNWMSAEGQGTLQKISSSIGTALGSGLKDVMMGALGLAESKEMVPKRRIDFTNEDRQLLLDQDNSLYAEAGRKAGDSFFQAFLGVFDTKQIADNLGGIQSEATIVKDETSQGDKTPKWLKGLGEFGEQLGMALLVEIMMKKVGGKWLSKGSSKVAREIGLDALGNIPSRIATYGRRGSNLSKALPFLGKVLGVAGLGFTIYDTQKYLDEKGITDVIQETPSRVWKQFNEPVTEINGKPVKDMGFFERQIESLKEQGNYLVNDYFSDLGKSIKTNWKVLTGDGKYTVDENGSVQVVNPQDNSTSHMNRSLKNKMIRNQPNEKTLMNQTFMNSNKFSGVNSIEKFPNMSNLKIIESFQTLGQGTTVNVTIPSGAVNLTINKDELDYEKIGNISAQKIASEVRLAMQNMN